jgi:hypothetical protein
LKPTLKEKSNDVLRHLVSTGAFIFRSCDNNKDHYCKKRLADWKKALEKAERMIEELPDG